MIKKKTAKPKGPQTQEQQPGVLISYLRAHTRLISPAPYILGIIVLIIVALLVYFGWFQWIGSLTAWGFQPWSWRSVFAGIAIFYIAIAPVFTVSSAWRVLIRPIMQMSVVTTPPTEFNARTGPNSARKGRARLGILVFGIIPAIVGLVALSLFVTVGNNLPTLRWIFLVVAVLFPATLYYLFNVSRRYSILTDLAANMNRIGLLTKLDDQQKEQTRQQRVLTYIRKFESTYGSLGREDLAQLQKAATLVRTPEPAELKADGSNPLSGVLGETRIPVLIATVLVTIGWIVALPPMKPVEVVAAKTLAGVIASVSNPVPSTSQIAESEPEVETDAKSEAETDAKSEAETDAKPELAPEWQDQFVPTRGLIPFTFLGAYFFSIQMLFRRYVRRDLSSSAFTGVSLRILMAVIGTWVLFRAIDSLGGGALSPDMRLVLAFLIGMLPTIVIQGLAEFSRKFFTWAGVMESLRNNYPVSRLDGLSVWHASRLEEEDLENVHGMATADIMELMIRTRFPPDRIVEWVDQAILYSQLAGAKEDDRELTDKLKEAGVRTATGLLVIQDQQKDELAELFEKKEFACLSLAGRAIRTKPNLDLILLWRELEVDHFKALDTLKPAPAQGP